MDVQFLTQWFGGAGAVFAVVFALFKAIWPEIKSQLDTRATLKKEENKLRDKEQQNTREMIEAVKVTNDLVAKNNEAFTNHNTLFNMHVEAVKDLREHQRTIKTDMHRRFDEVEDRLEVHHTNAIRIEHEQSEIVAGLRRVHGESRFPEKEGSK